MSNFLLLGFLVGMSHALEADHLAAVGAMAARQPGSRRNMTLRGLSWGLGHALTLLVICSMVLVFGFALTDERVAMLEFAVGVMLVLLGIDVLLRMRRRRIHFHLHQHGDGQMHIHAHSHAGADIEHEQDPHQHRHQSGFSVRALTVGLVHGAAGSAGLLTLCMAATREASMALAYVLLFGLGSIAGMGLLSFAVSWPLGAAERRMARLHAGVSAIAGMVAIGIGVELMLATGAVAWGVL